MMVHKVRKKPLFCSTGWTEFQILSEMLRRSGGCLWGQAWPPGADIWGGRHGTDTQTHPGDQRGQQQAEVTGAWPSEGQVGAGEQER